MSHDIFVSYSRRDTERMVQISERLRSAGFKVWTDEGIEPGTESWKQALSSAIKDCKIVVVLFSPDSAESTWVHRELDFAELHKKKIYPLLLRGEPAQSIPFGYTTFQFIDIRHDHSVQEGIQELINTLHKHIDSTTTSAPVQPDTQETATVIASEPPKPQPEEVLWKWVETDEIRMTLPHTARVSPPDELNMQRVLRLLVGNDDRLTVRLFQDMDRLGYLSTGIPFIKIRPTLLFSDIANISPMAGIVVEFSAWFFTPFDYLYLPYLMKTSWVKTSMNKMSKRFDANLDYLVWHRYSGARVAITLAHSHTRQGITKVVFKNYSKLFPGFRKNLLVAMSCEESQFTHNESIFDQIAKSLVYI
jgi:hypothetical protein